MHERSKKLLVIVFIIIILGIPGLVLASGERDGFVSANGTEFELDGAPFYYTGTNNYYLGIDSNRTQAEIDEVFADASEMGLSVIRAWAFNDGTGGLQTSAGVYDESVFQQLDYAIDKAGDYNIKLILPVVNNWDDYGGMNQYVDWSPTTNKTLTNNAWGQGAKHNQFYTDANCIQYYEDHLSTLLNRTNTYNGLDYKDDPTIFAWELANEPRVEGDLTGDILNTWIDDMSGYIKSVDSDHMVTTGLEGFYDENTGSDWKRNGWTGTDFIDNHDHDDIDFATYHIYTDYWGFNYTQSMDWAQEHTDDAHDILDKPVVLEEFGKYRDSGGGTTVRDTYYEGFNDLIYDNEAAGSNFWILYHDTYPDYDGFGVYYPNDTSTIEVIKDGVANSQYLMSQTLDTVSLTQGNVLHFTPPSGWTGELTYSQDLDAAGFIGALELTGLLPNHAYLLSFEGSADNIPMTAEELASYGIRFDDNGRLTMGGGLWPNSASGDYGEYEGEQVAFIDFKLISTDASGDYSGRFFFNALGNMDPGWYYTRFIVKDAYSWTIYDNTGTWRNEVLYANDIDFDPPFLPESTVPEPSTLLLLGSGLLGAGLFRRRR